MENKLCHYCHTDRDGYTQSLPREGNGNVKELYLDAYKKWENKRIKV